MHCMCMQRQRTRRHGFSRCSACTPRGQPVRRRAAHHAVPRRGAAAGSPVCYGYPVYFGIPGGPMHPGAPCKAPHAGPPGSGEPGVLRISGILKFRAAMHTRGPLKAPRAARERGARCVTDVRYFEIPGGPTRGPQGPQGRQRDRNIQDFRLDLKLSWPPPIRATWVGASGPEIWLPGRISAKAFPERIRPKSGPEARSPARKHYILRIMHRLRLTCSPHSPCVTAGLRLGRSTNV